MYGRERIIRTHAREKFDRKACPMSENDLSTDTCVAFSSYQISPKLSIKHTGIISFQINHHYFVEKDPLRTSSIYLRAYISHKTTVAQKKRKTHN